MTPLTLDEANGIMAAALARGADLGLRPLGVAVLDAGGHLVAFQRQDGASMLRFEIAFGKAYGALAVGVGSREIARMAAERPALVQGLLGISGGRIVPAPGGVLIRRDGGIVGAVGITGDSSDRDEECAVVAVERAGLTAEA